MWRGMFGAGWRMSLARGTGTIWRGAFISSPSVPLRNISHTESCSSAPLCSFLLRSLDVNFKVTGGGQARAEFRGGHPLLAHPFEDGCQGEIWAIVERLTFDGAMRVWWRMLVCVRAPACPAHRLGRVAWRLHLRARGCRQGCGQTSPDPAHFAHRAPPLVAGGDRSDIVREPIYRDPGAQLMRTLACQPVPTRRFWLRLLELLHALRSILHLAACPRSRLSRLVWASRFASAVRCRARAR